MSIVTSQASIDIYPSSTPNGDYLAVLQNSKPGKSVLPPINNLSTTVSSNGANNWEKTRLVIMVDQSGSMYGSFTGLICRTLPTFFKELGVPDSFVVDLILFTDHTVYRRLRVDEFSELRWEANGCERLAPCMSVVREILDSCEYGSLARLITFSDGEIGDLNAQMTASAELYQYIQSTIAPKVLVSSHGFRVMSSDYASPDTRALSSVLQFHTLPGEMPQLLDLNCNYSFMYQSTLSASAIQSLDQKATVNGVDDPQHPITHGKIIAKACVLKTPLFAALSTPNTITDFFANPTAYLPQNTLSATELMGMDTQTANTRTQQTQAYVKYPESHKLMFLDVPFCKLVRPNESYSGYSSVGYQHNDEQIRFTTMTKHLKELKKTLQVAEEAAAAVAPAETPTPAPAIGAVDARTALSMFKTAPWCEGSPILTVHIDSIRTLFWLDKPLFDAYLQNKGGVIDSSLFTISDNTNTVINVEMHKVITSQVYQDIIESRINYYVMQAKLLKLVDKDVSKNTISKMVSYFTQLESCMTSDLPTESIADENSHDLSNSLRARIVALKSSMKSAHRQLALQLSQINNMDAVGSFNNAQAASFLRTTAGSSKASRGLVNRHGAALDFSSIVRDEIIQMAKKLPELEQQLLDANEDEFSHNQSFVSLGTTLDGIRAVVSLALTTSGGTEYATYEEVGQDETLLDSMPALDILSFLNIVGVPIQAMVAEGGDYPDPFRYGIKAIFPGHYCSLSDLITHHQNAQKELGERYVYNQLKGIEIPGFKNDGLVDSVVPLFDSPLIFQFLYQNAPQSLNYYASVGMRRMIADIPGTLPATLTAALIKLMRVISVEPTEVNINAFLNIYESLKACSTVKFNISIYKELLDMIKYDMTVNAAIEDESARKLPVVETNFTQLLFPLMQLYQIVVVQKSNSLGKKLIKELDESFGKEYTNNFSDMEKVRQHFNIIFRTIYTNEVWTTLRSAYRGNPDSDNITTRGVFDLIGFDMEYKLKLEKTDITFDSDTGKAISPDFNANDETGKFARPLAERQVDSYFNSKIFTSSQNKINHLNVLLLIPHFTHLITSSKDKKKEEFEELLKNTPTLFVAAESIFQQIKSKQLTEEDRIQNSKKQIKVISANINKLYRNVFYSSSPEHTELPEITFETIKLVKLLNIAYTYFFPTVEDRYPQSDDGRVPHIHDWNTLLVNQPKVNTIAEIAPTHQFFSIMEERFAAQSINLYRSLKNELVNSVETEVFGEYCEMLLSSASLDEYCTLMRDGIIRYNKAFTFKDPHSVYFSKFFKNLTTQQKEIPLQCDKILITINGRTDDGQTVWNNGDLLFVDKLHKISHLFYAKQDDETTARSKWIEFSAQYLTRKRSEMWKYRDSDLPNRHSHHVTHPSFWGLGYSTMEEFKGNVSSSEFKKYCKEHEKCCGLGKGERIRHWINLDDTSKPYHKQND